jgi:hypothetical protein
MTPQPPVDAGFPGSPTVGAGSRPTQGGLTIGEWLGLALALVALTVSAATWTGFRTFVAPQILPRLALWGWVPLVVWLLWVMRRQAWAESRRVRALVLLVAAVLVLPACGLGLLATVFGGSSELALTDAPAGQVPLYVIYHNGGFLGGGCTQVATSAFFGLVIRPIGVATCHDFESIPPYAPRSVRFERFPDRGLAVLVGDSNAEMGDGGPNRYLELFRLDDGPTRPVGPWGAGPVPVIGSAARDQALRAYVAGQAGVGASGGAP